MPGKGQPYKKPLAPYAMGMPSRQELYYNRPMPKGSTQYKTPAEPTDRALTLLQQIRGTPGVVQRAAAKGSMSVSVNRSAKGNKKYVMGE
jgi:hypothetical protein